MPPTEEPGFPPTMPMNASALLELPLAAPIASALKARAPAMRSPVRDTLIDERMMIFPHCVDARERARRMPGSITLQAPPSFARITSTRWVSDQNLTLIASAIWGSGSNGTESAIAHRQPRDF